MLEETNWVAGAPPTETFEAEVQVRHRQHPIPARVSAQEDGAVRLEFTEPMRAVAPGQSGVLYRAEEVLSGGVIREARH